MWRSIWQMLPLKYRAVSVLRYKKVCPVITPFGLLWSVILPFFEYIDLCLLASKNWHLFILFALIYLALPGKQIISPFIWWTICAILALEFKSPLWIIIDSFYEVQNLALEVNLEMLWLGAKNNFSKND